MTYADRLRDPRWLEYRDRIIRRDGGRCCDCGTDKELQVHHLAYWFGADPWDYEPETLRTLCKPCHERAEAERYGFLVDWGRLRQFQRQEVAREVADMLPKPPPRAEPEADPYEELERRWFNGLSKEEQHAEFLRLIEFKRSCIGMEHMARRDAQAEFQQRIIDLANAAEVATDVH